MAGVERHDRIIRALRNGRLEEGEKIACDCRYLSGKSETVVILCLSFESLFL